MAKQLTVPCKCLRWISVAYCGWIVDDSLVQLFLNNRNLLSVNLNGCEGLNGAALQSGLQKIDARGCWDVDDETFKNFFMKFPGLKEVRLSRVEAVSDNTLYFLAHGCPELEVLDVSQCWRVSENGIKQVIEYCKRLRVLNVEGCRDISETYLCSLQIKRIKVIPHHNVCEIAKKRRRVNHLGINIQI
ncbi:F-box/LRR-repeat protein 15-like [Macrobrachium nipponense]|uniref:F-box/LRR-repeat protein 15-like n=1 Tax=Macrobrachium nipponense TaxID=159736 RepID=UPI0030C81134